MKTIFKIDKCPKCNQCLSPRADGKVGNYSCIMKFHKVIPNLSEVPKWCPRRGWTMKWPE